MPGLGEVQATLKRLRSLEYLDVLLSVLGIGEYAGPG